MLDKKKQQAGIGKKHHAVSLEFPSGGIAAAFNKLKFQPAPLVVGLILGPNIEKHFREVLFLSQGDPWIYLESPIAITVWLTVAAILIAGFVARRRATFADAMARESSL